MSGESRPKDNSVEGSMGKRDGGEGAGRRLEKVQGAGGGGVYKMRLTVRKKKGPAGRWGKNLLK